MGRARCWIIRLLCMAAVPSDSNRHLHDNLPLLVAGGGAGKLRPRRHIRYPKDR